MSSDKQSTINIRRDRRSRCDSVASRENNNQSFSNTLGFASLPRLSETASLSREVARHSRDGGSPAKLSIYTSNKLPQSRIRSTAPSWREPKKTGVLVSSRSPLRPLALHSSLFTLHSSLFTLRSSSPLILHSALFSFFP